MLQLAECIGQQDGACTAFPPGVEIPSSDVACMPGSPHFHLLLRTTAKASLDRSGLSILVFLLTNVFKFVNMLSFLPPLVLVVSGPLS